MEYHYLLSVAFCFSPFIISGIWFSLHNNARVKPSKPRMLTSPAFLATEDWMLRDYFYGVVESAGPFNRLMANLKKVNLIDPELREHNKMDDWFYKATPKLMHSGKCLAYINHYGHLNHSFWHNMEVGNFDPEHDLEFQKLLVSVCETCSGMWMTNFGNLLSCYGEHYKLLPEIEDILDTDARFESAKITYNLARNRFRKKAS